MARPKVAKLNEMSSEKIEKNFLQETPEDIPEPNKTVVIADKVPEMETIVFRNDRDPGVPLEFHYASATHPLHHYRLFHDKEVTLPTEVVRHLERCAVPSYGYRKGGDGHPEMYVTGYRYQFSCRPVRKNALAA